MLDDAGIERILVVTAHPDDVDFGAVGTVARWTDAGIEVTYCVVTDGDAGGFDTAVPRERIPAIRRDEQRAAAGCVGVDDVRFLGYPDGALELTHELRRDITRVIRQVRPQRMLIHSPERNWARVQVNHPDHLTAGEAALRAIYPDARNPFAHPALLRDEGLAEWTVAEAWLMAAPPERINHHVDITDVFERKLAALKAHESQTAHMDGLETLLRRWMGENARRASLAPESLAESFQVISTG